MIGSMFCTHIKVFANSTTIVSHYCRAIVSNNNATLTLTSAMWSAVDGPGGTETRNTCCSPRHHILTVHSTRHGQYLIVILQCNTTQSGSFMAQTDWRGGGLLSIHGHYVGGHCERDGSMGSPLTCACLPTPFQL
jgi:hypothetical protein